MITVNNQHSIDLKEKAAGGEKQHGIMIPELPLGNYTVQ
jgi:hypothetical protein